MASDNYRVQELGAPPDAETQAAWKRATARLALDEIPNGAVLGLGSGTTAEILLSELAERMRQGLRVTGVPTSERTAQVAASLGIPLANLDDVPFLTMSFDGADEVRLPQLDLIKGRGGALLREKLTAASSRHRIIIADNTKLVTTLATHHPVPVEVVAFGWRHTAERLAAIGANPVLRLSVGAQPNDPHAPPFVTDGGNYVLDCSFGPLTQPGVVATQIKAITGVVDHGLFIGMTDRVYVGGPDGVHRYERPH